MDPIEARRVLGVPTDAGVDEVEASFRRAARVAHPDLGGDPAAFRRLVEARAELCSQQDGPTRPPPIRVVRRPWWQRLVDAVLDGLPPAWRPRRSPRDLH